ncbi:MULTISPECIES: hypothetical protein [Sphingobacterium]|jgi:hypothetical protein|uniref:DUF1735 domain-containing protein n=1 Tax=Sphingobacterium multivorum TaxID=28454 RepID=A0A654CYN7_SPHMU|nr:MULTISPECIES: hypothetical protein [Sphingobacterium]QQT44837.1 hypothetical protein I6J00_24575 [Sphingobacterium multivorum]QQT62435.1 hypothetical protein I6I97_01020 [Sphingobacterium multivorum]QRQ59596.1 hypothetical protein I6J33_15565 [Sphingobacterium multivorum]SUJ17755.1 Uncharacterised protein [Sphingobacterium multivorum]VXC98192.1 conserved exported hypothetical protein [Sphingobacterium multivorum]
MKRLLLAALIGTAALVSFSSCKKEYVSNYLPGRSFIYTVKPNEWTSDNNKRIIHKVNLPELTDYYIKQGDVSVHMSLNNEASYKILPASFAFDDGKEINPVSFHVDYKVGEVSIIGEDPTNDFSVNFPTQNIIVKIVLTDTDYVQ